MCFTLRQAADEALRKPQYLMGRWWDCLKRHKTIGCVQVEFKWLLWLYIALNLLCPWTLDIFQVSYLILHIPTEAASSALNCGIRLFHRLAVWMGERLEERLISMSGSIWHGSCCNFVGCPAWTESTWKDRKKSGRKEIRKERKKERKKEGKKEGRKEGRKERRKQRKKERRKENLQNTYQHQQKTSAFGEDHKYRNHTLSKL